MNGCPAPETLAAFAEGKLERREIAAILEHLVTCDSCKRALQTANEEVVAEQRPGFRTATWLAIAAATALIFITVPLMWNRGATPAARLVALAPQSERLTEARLSGGFAWARYRGPVRSTEPSNDPRRLELMGAAGELVRRANEQKSASLEHAAGIGLVMIELPLDAVVRLHKAAELEPNNAKTWSDLAAAQFSAAAALERPSMIPEALASADRALRIDPELAEAAFNRALIIERLGLTEQAREAWKRYLAIDGTSGWAVEAREHLGRLGAATSDSLFNKEMLRLEKETDVAAIVDRYRQQTRTTAEVLTLGQWAAAFQRGDRDEAARKLATARAIGDALLRLSGERLLHDAVHAIDIADAQRQATLAEAHATYLRGRLAYGRHEPAAAEPDLRNAARLFGDDPMALVARYFAACTRFDQNGVIEARNELAAINTNYTALDAQIRWQLALCSMIDDDWQGALPLVTAARDAFNSLGEKSNGGFLDALLADTLVALGRPDEGWSARIRSFALLSAEGRGDRLPVSLDGAARMELRAGNLVVARSMLQIEESVNRQANNTTLLTNTLAREAVLSAKLGDFATASHQAREASAIAARIDDAALRTRATIDASFALGAAERDPRQARIHLTNAIDGYRQLERPLFLPEAHLLRARAELQLGDRDAAAHDLDRGIERITGSVVGSGIFDAGTALFHDAIRLSLDRHDVAKAFAYAEQSRFQWSDRRPRLSDPRAIQHHLAGTRAAVLELVVLDDEIVSFCMTESDLTAARRPIAASRIPQLNDEQLYDLLIGPSSSAIASARELIIVADPLFDGVSFAAMRDSRTHQRLIERIPIASAPSASVLQLSADAVPHSLVAVALSKGPTLPQTHAEITELASLYRNATEMTDATFASLTARAQSADVIHIAGHTERTPGAGEAVLVFHGERISGKRAASNALASAPVVMLAACETLRHPRSPGTFALSLGDGFLAAGASAVIGTITPVPDNDAREMFSAIHRHLLKGESPATALQQAQLEGRADLPWRAIALLTDRISRS